MHTFPLTTLNELTLQNVAAELVTYRGRAAVKLIESSEPADDGHAIAIIADSTFEDGDIETEIAGLPQAGANEGARGFIGIAFRVQPHDTHFECFYLRPTNGRANDQLRRNHATQYISQPDYPWHKLRAEDPGVYESYTDLVTGEWTKIKIVVSGMKAQLYVNGADQPCLIVNDLKLGETSGAIALWIGGGTEAYFSEVIVQQG
jgi:hypothetical protein